MAKKKKSTAEVATGTVYLVQEKVYEALNEELLDLLEDMDDDEFDIEDIDQAEGWAPVKGFRDQTAAESCRRALEDQRRTNENPFARGKTLSDWTHFGAAQFHDWLLDAGLEPPKTKKPSADDWRSWWKLKAKKMSALQRAKVWEALDKVVYYQVVKLTE